MKKLNLKDAKIERAEVSFAEKVARFITHPVVIPILLSIGSLGLIVELYSPGFGIPIVPTWEEYTPVHTDELIIEMDPGMAFGTGTHPVIAGQAAGIDFKEIGLSQDGLKANGILVKKGSGIDDIKDLKGKKVAVAKDWAFSFFLG